MYASVLIETNKLKKKIETSKNQLEVIINHSIFSALKCLIARGHWSVHNNDFKFDI